jgi:mercuric reductase
MWLAFVAIVRSGFAMTASAAPSGARDFAADRLLVATGRRPHSQGMGLEEQGVALNAQGAIVVNEHLQSSVPTIYAAGDVTGQAMFVYVAAAQGGVAARHALELGGGQINDLTAVPRVTFTDPQVASAGMTEAEAQAAGLRCECRSVPLTHVPRALANRAADGFVKRCRQHERADSGAVHRGARCRRND